MSLFRTQFAVLFVLAAACNRAPFPSQLSEFKLPPAPQGNQRINGSAFIDTIENLPEERRELETEMQITAGNFPDFLRQFVPIFIDGYDANQRAHRLLVYVMPDYLSVGNNNDYVRIPMRPATAQRIAETLALMLPTPKIVDEIYRNSQVSINPVSLRASPYMTSARYFQDHNKMIEEQLGSLPRGMLVTGPKKDIVITSRLSEFPDRVAIYGWHRVNGLPVQRLNLDHAHTYADYSHGVRLISRHAILDGVGIDLADLIKDPILNSLISNDGIVAINAYDRRSSRVGFAH